MPSLPLLFDLGSTRPTTTRDIASTVKAGGTAALTEAERRADRARYQEIRVQGMVRVLQERYGLRTRNEADAEQGSPEAPQESEQVGFAW